MKLYAACYIGPDYRIPLDVAVSRSSAITRAVDHYDQCHASGIAWAYPAGKTRTQKWAWLRKHVNIQIIEFDFNCRVAPGGEGS
jgi:hypothetical protein